MFSWECFEIATPKTLENIQKNVFSGVLIPNWKFHWKYFSGSAQKRKEILRFRKKDPTIVFPVSFFRKQSKWRHFIIVAGLLSKMYKPLKRTCHTKFPEKRLWWIEFAVQFTIYNYPENWLHRKYFLWVFRFFKIARRASLEESLFSKVIGEISTLHNLSKTLSLALVSFKK